MLLSISELEAKSHNSDTDSILNKNIPLGDITNVILKGGGILSVSQGDENILNIETPVNSSYGVEYEVKQTSLVLRVKHNVIDGNIIFHVVMKNIKGFKLMGGSLVNKTPIKSSDLVLRLDGSGKINLTNLEVGKLFAEVNGSGNISASGSATDSKIEINGSGDLDLSLFESKIVKASINGSGDCLVWVLDKLDARISGSGSIKYKGEPKVFNSYTSGSGNISKL